MNRFVMRVGAGAVVAALALVAGQAMAQPYPQQGDYPPQQAYPSQQGYPPQSGYPGYAGPNGMPPNPGNRPQRVVHCESNGWARNFCAIPLQPNDKVRVLRRYSERPCAPGRTWFSGPDGIYVDNGCRADFLVVTRRAQPQVAYLGPAQGQRDRREPANGGGYPQQPQYANDPRGMPEPGAYGPDDRGNMPPPGSGQPGGDDPGAYGPAAGPYPAPPRRGSVTVRDPDQPARNPADPAQAGCADTQGNDPDGANCAQRGDDSTQPR